MCFKQQMFILFSDGSGILFLGDSGVEIGLLCVVLSVLELCRPVWP